MSVVGGVTEPLHIVAGRARICFEPEALAVFDRHRQVRCYHREAGGQLFGKVIGKRWVVMEATRPGKGDRRSRFSFLPDRNREQREINEMFDKGLVYLGDWHTHPEKQPSPSWRDIDTFRDIVGKSAHYLPGLVLCIVGQKYFPEGLSVSYVDNQGAVYEGFHLVE